jgi:hypothetical protein
MFLLLGWTACGPKSPEETASDGPVEPTSTSTSVGGTNTTTGPSTTSTATSTSTTSEAPTSADSADTGSFVSMPDLPPTPVACDPWQDTCPRGQKCKPFRDGEWKAVCADIDEEPKGVGEACSMGTSTPFDDCPDGTMCFDFLGAEEGLRCTPLCEGTPDDWSCADVCSGCVRLQVGFFGVCPARCNPLVGGCPGDQICTAFVAEPRFFCFPEGDGLVGPGEVCATPPQCQEGLACVPADMLPSCDGPFCCTPVCDQGQPDTCGAALSGTVCSPWPVLQPDFHAECLAPGLGLCRAEP